MAADAMGRFFYAVSVSAAFRGNQNGGNGISEYTIDQANGSLSPIKGAPILFADADRNLTTIVVDANGKFAYITDNNSAAGRNGIFSYSIDQSSGLLSPVSGSPFGTSAGLLLAVTPNGKDLLNAGNGQIVAYTLNNGQPTPAGAPLPGGGNFGGPAPSPGSGQLLSRSDSAFVYLLDKSASAVDVYAVGANGALTTVAGSPFKVGTSGSGDNMALTPDGRFLYVETFDSSTGRSSLSGYTVNTSTGAVGSALPGSPFISNDANALAVVLADFSGKFLFANTSAGVTTYNIGSDGSLTKSSVSTPSGATEQDFALVH
jgi:6-phosphogluconolactonase (cycloisomerase 2 family)